MMEWLGIALLLPLLMCAAMMIGGVALAVFGLQRRDRQTVGTDRADHTDRFDRSEVIGGRS